MRDAVIVSGARTAVGAFGGSLKTIPVADLGAAVLKASLKKVGLRPVAGELAGKFEASAVA
jgi:acetyl-CoA C-acetyltransferase